MTSASVASLSLAMIAADHHGAGDHQGAGLTAHVGQLAQPDRAGRAGDVDHLDVVHDAVGLQRLLGLPGDQVPPAAGCGRRDHAEPAARRITAPVSTALQIPATTTSTTTTVQTAVTQGRRAPVRACGGGLDLGRELPSLAAFASGEGSRKGELVHARGGRAESVRSRGRY